MTPLEAEIRRIIETDGPISVADYMRLCLGHPQHGYYVTRDPLGARGDFITAPEVSQMFGELIGAWAAAVWQQMGAPREVSLVEFGPGRGTLMADALRAAKAMPEFADAPRWHDVIPVPVPEFTTLVMRDGWNSLTSGREARELPRRGRGAGRPGDRRSPRGRASCRT